MSTGFNPDDFDSSDFERSEYEEPEETDEEAEETDEEVDAEQAGFWRNVRNLLGSAYDRATSARERVIDRPTRRHPKKAVAVAASIGAAMLGAVQWIIPNEKSPQKDEDRSVASAAADPGPATKGKGKTKATSPTEEDAEVEADEAPEETDAFDGAKVVKSPNDNFTAGVVGGDQLLVINTEGKRVVDAKLGFKPLAGEEPYFDESSSTISVMEDDYSIHTWDLQTGEQTQ